jgi:hypothetical protein
MARREAQPRPHRLANINQIIHAPARLMVLTYLYVVESADYVFLMQLTGLTRLERAGYVNIHKGFKGRKPHSSIRLTAQGRSAFRAYRTSMQQVLNDLPD